MINPLPADGHCIGRRLYSVLLALIGIVLTGGGGTLAALGGSLYYLIAGAIVLASGVMLWTASRWGAWLYSAMLVFTLSWALLEAGFDGWALVPRLVAPFVLGAGFLIPAVWSGVAAAGASGAPPRHADGWAAFCLAFLAALVIGAAAHAIGPAAPADPQFQAGVQSQTPAARLDQANEPQVAADGDWLNYGNDPGGSRFSPLRQLTPANVKDLKVAWTVHMGRSSDGKLGNLEMTPLKVGNSVYACTAFNDILAIDAETGQVKWRYRSGVKFAGQPVGACRGVAYYAVPGFTGPCATRVITNTVDARLIAVDAQSGALCAGFGENGQTDLSKGVGMREQGYYFVSSAPTLVRGKIVLGGFVLDNQYWGEPSGVIRAYDAVTGKLAWAFDIGRPDDHGPPPSGQTFTLSSPNSWAPMSADPDLGLVYAPTGNSVPDYYGAQRRPFDDKYSSSVVALDAQTGQVRWSFQTTRHDLWDYDVASQPTLIDLPGPGGVRKALIQPTKRGEMFLLDRTNGQPLAAVEERSAPQAGHAPGERLSATQPFSVGMPSFRGPDLRESDMWGITPLDQMLCRIRFRQARYQGPLTPPGLAPNIAHPGFLGGVDWGGVSVDRDRNLMIVNSNRVPNYDRLLTRKAADTLGIKPAHSIAKPADEGSAAQANTPFAADIEPFLSPLGSPCNKPPYGMISAVDLTTHKLVWSHPLGSARDSGPLGLPSMLPITMGVPNAGGSLVTRGGLIFIAATQERVIRALDVTNGKIVWEARLPSGGHASPMSYWSERSKRQFVVLAAGGNLQLASKPGDSLISYALPHP